MEAVVEDVEGGFLGFNRGRGVSTRGRESLGVSPNEAHFRGPVRVLVWRWRRREGFALSDQVGDGAACETGADFARFAVPDGSEDVVVRHEDFVWTAMSTLAMMLTMFAAMPTLAMFAPMPAFATLAAMSAFGAKSPSATFMLIALLMVSALAALFCMALTTGVLFVLCGLRRTTTHGDETNERDLLVHILQQLLFRLLF